eukprot:10927826-Prorocentrum_lima.AAC.1
MTSSLVGSEMCIRDSQPTHCQPRVAQHASVAFDARLEPRLVPWSCPRPVSYTHLTLPTICSV